MASNGPEQLEAGRVGPLQVFQDEHNDAFGRKRSQGSLDGVEARRRAAGQRQRRGVGRPIAHELEPRTIRWCIGQVVCMPGKYVRASSGRVTCEGAHQRSLADASLAADEDQLSTTTAGPDQVALKLGELVRAADQAGWWLGE